MSKVKGVSELAIVNQIWFWFFSFNAIVLGRKRKKMSNVKEVSD